MPRYEFQEGSSNKFWEIQLEGSSFTTTYGRIGTSGQSSTKDYDSDEKAKHEYDKLVAEKVKKGYELVSRSAEKSAKTPVKSAKSKPFEDEGDDEEEAPKPKAKAAAKPAAKPAGKTGGKSGALYFEFVDGSSAKFWEITLQGESFRTRYGKIGTDGQVTLKEYDSAEKAKKEYDKLIAEKTHKGYEQK